MNAVSRVTAFKVETLTPTPCSGFGDRKFQDRVLEQGQVATDHDLCRKQAAGDQAWDHKGKTCVKKGAKVQPGSQARLGRALWVGGGDQALPLQTCLWIELGRAVGAINSQLPPGWRTENNHPNSTHSHKVDTYIGGNDSLLPSGSLWLTGVPTLLGFLELMAGSFTCVKKTKSMS